jgi:hypothetical protein
MKKALLLFAIGIGLVAIAVAGVDFSGTWVFDASKAPQAGGPPGGGGGGMGGGRGMGGGNMTITQTGNELTISQMRGEQEQKTVYIMDGAEHSSEAAGGTMKYKAVLSGDTVAITGTRTTQRGEMPLNTKYTLSADGKVLTVTNVMNMGGEERVMTSAYNKK